MRKNGFLELTAATVFGLVMLAASAVGVLLGQVALSRKTPPPSKAQFPTADRCGQNCYGDYDCNYPTETCEYFGSMCHNGQDYTGKKCYGDYDCNYPTETCEYFGSMCECKSGSCINGTCQQPAPTPTTTPIPTPTGYVCGSQNCTGCCLNNTCYPGTSDTRCGKNGVLCTACPSGTTCTDGTCTTPTATPTPSPTPTGTLTPTPCYFKRTLKLIDMATGKLNNDGTFTWQSNYEGTGTVVSSYTFERNNLSQANLPFNDQIRLIPPDGWEVRSAFCELPQIKEGYPANLPVQCYVQDKTVKIAILCGAIYEYGWLVQKLSTPIPTLTPIPTATLTPVPPPAGVVISGNVTVNNPGNINFDSVPVSVSDPNNENDIKGMQDLGVNGGLFSITSDKIISGQQYQVRSGAWRDATGYITVDRKYVTAPANNINFTLNISETPPGTGKCRDAADKAQTCPREYGEKCNQTNYHCKAKEVHLQCNPADVQPCSPCHQCLYYCEEADGTETTCEDSDQICIHNIPGCTPRARTTDLNNDGRVDALDWSILVNGWNEGIYDALDASSVLHAWAAQAGI